MIDGSKAYFQVGYDVAFRGGAKEYFVPEYLKTRSEFVTGVRRMPTIF